MLVEHPTEMWTSRLCATNERSQPDVYADSAGHAYVQSVWPSAYDAINRANSVLDHVPDHRHGHDAPRPDHLARRSSCARRTTSISCACAAAFRSSCTRREGLDSLAIPRNTAQEVYAQIEQDLKDAIAVLPSAKTYTGADVGRASSGAAKTLLAKVYLQRAGTARRHRGRGLAERAGDGEAGAVGRRLLAGRRLQDAVRLHRRHGERAEQRGRSSTIENIRAPGLGGRIGVARCSERDGAIPRRVDERLVRGGEHLVRTRSARTTSGATARSCCRGIATAPSSTGRRTDAASSPYASETPFPRKFLDPLMTGTGAEEPNYIVLRYAEVLLMIAEAANEVERRARRAEAYTAVNAVRARAGIPSMTPGLSHDLFRDSVFNERRWELSLEGPNGYFDSQRNWAWAKARDRAEHEARAVEQQQVPEGEQHADQRQVQADADSAARAGSEPGAERARIRGGNGPARHPEERSTRGRS